MKKGFVLTENFRRLHEALSAVDKRGPREAGLVVVQSAYGVGKSTLLARLAADNQVIFVRCKETWTKRSLLDELCEVMGLDKRGRNSEVQGRIIGKLAVSMLPLCFDEADHLIRSTASLLEVVRDITDMTECACLLVGMSQSTGSRRLGFLDSLSTYPHIASRVNRVVELQPLSLADVQAACARLSEVDIEPNLVAQIHVESQGRMRLVLGAISNIEQLAAANGWKKVGAEHVKGKSLVVEFKGRTLGRRAEAV